MAFLNRIVQRREGQKILEGLPTSKMTCAEVSGDYWKDRLPWSAAESFHFPDHDICKDVFRDAKGDAQSFDMVIADQVWEHLQRPYAATRNVFSMLKPGGYFYIAVPFYVRYHAFPVDCTRWTALGLANLLIESGFDASLITSAQWGNLEVAKKDCSKKWAKFNRDEDDLRNDPDFPIVSWALARKSPEAEAPKPAPKRKVAVRKTARPTA